VRAVSVNVHVCIIMGICVYICVHVCTVCECDGGMGVYVCVYECKCGLVCVWMWLWGKHDHVVGHVAECVKCSGGKRSLLVICASKHSCLHLATSVGIHFCILYCL